jgi:N-acetylmuramoyl-L-alanine amidase
MKKYLVTLMLTLTFMVSSVYQVAAEGSVGRLGGQDRFEVAVNVSQHGWSSASTVVIANYNAFADALAAAPLAYKHNAPILLTAPTTLNGKTKLEIQRLRATRAVIVGGTKSVSNSVLNELKAMGLNVERISGANRFEVANNVALKLGKSSKVIVANGYNFPDALAIAPYAARNGYPILLTEPSVLPSATINLINQWGISQTIIVGGPVSVSPNVQNSVPNPLRVDGQDRYAVSANIANSFFINQQNTFVATGRTFADALTGSVLAAKYNTPILLTNSNDIPYIVKDTIIKRGYQSFTILGGPVSVSSNIYYTLSNPIVGKHIMIDPGHGGKDPGAAGYKLIEKEIVFDVSNRVNARLFNSLAKVSMTRTDDTFLELDQRVQKAHQSGADIFTSIHVNSYSSSTANGTETYYNTSYASTESKELAQEIQEELVKALGTYDRGVKQGSFYVIRYTEIPSVLIEIAFVSNPKDAAKLANNTFRQKAADAIYKGIMNFYNK